VDASVSCERRYLSLIVIEEEYLSDVRHIAQLILDPSVIPAREHLTRFAQVLGRSATVRALAPAEPWRILSDFEMYDTTDGQAIFCHMSPFEYQRGELENPDVRARASVAITVCLEGELILTYSRDHQVKATPGQLVLGLTRASTHITVPVPSRYVILYIARPTMLSATSLTDAHPVIEASVPESVRPVVSTMLHQLRYTLSGRDDVSLGPILKALEVLIDQVARSQFLRLSQISEDRMMAIQAFVDENVRNPNLGVKLLCDRFHMSRATLYRQMKYLGGVKHYLQSRRLVCCYDDMRKSRYSDESFLKILVKSYHFKSLRDFRQRHIKHFGIDPHNAAGDRGVTVMAPNPTDQVFVSNHQHVDS
jgi:AraC-like DNA-binding protein